MESKEVNDRNINGVAQETAVEWTNGSDSGSDSGSIRGDGLRLKHPSQKVAQTKDILSKQADKIARLAGDHERSSTRALIFWVCLDFVGFVTSSDPDQKI